MFRVRSIYWHISHSNESDILFTQKSKPVAYQKLIYKFAAIKWDVYALL